MLHGSALPISCDVIEWLISELPLHPRGHYNFQALICIAYDIDIIAFLLIHAVCTISDGPLIIIIIIYYYYCSYTHLSAL